MKKILILIIVVVLVVLAFAYGKPSDKVVPEAAAADTTASIDEDLNSISADGGFEADMESLDTDINSL
ncbi:MAG: hypothetical protein Q7R93_05530 [bacterium]|nr:hypothetical protein [bacterium]